MSFFGKLFSGKNKENNESEYLDRVYESLGDESDLNPDRILDENNAADPASAYDEIELMTDKEELSFGAAEESVGDFDMSETFESGFKAETADTEPEEDDPDRVYAEEPEAEEPEAAEYENEFESENKYEYDSEYEAEALTDEYAPEAEEAPAETAETLTEPEGGAAEYEPEASAEETEVEASEAEPIVEADVREYETEPDDEYEPAAEEIELPGVFYAPESASNVMETDAEPDLTDTDLTEPDLTEPDLTEPDLTDTDLIEPDLTETDLTENKDVFYERDAYSALEDDKGDTDEMDVDQLLSAMKEADSYIEPEPMGEMISYASEPNEHVSPDDPSYALLSSDIDTDEVYTAYAPKSMRPRVTETSYYDLDDMDDSDNEPKKESRFKKFVTKNKKWIIGAAVAAAVVLTTVGALFFARWRMNPLMGYTELYVTKGNIIKTMEAGGSVEPNARYNIIPPVGGTIIESPLNAGDAVRAGELVYKIDDTNAQIAVQQAQNAVSRAQQEPTTSTTTSERVNIYANSSGTISGLNISSGSRITGGQIATITQANGTEIGLIPSVTGTVERVNVSNGSTVSSGQVVAVVTSDSASNTNINPNTRENDITAANLALEQAQKDLEKYKIAAPIDGTILVKNSKVGDSVVEGTTDQPMMVIADMSKMKLKIDVDELDIWNIELGQTVVITVGALPGETFSGEITNIAGEGEKKGDGVTSYAVEITVNDPGKIKSGMNVDAKIIIDSAINVLSLPESALYESDGENALVITDGGDDSEAVDPEDYPEITVPSGYRLVKVKYGVSDGDNVEIISGLSVGDAVLHKLSEDGESEPVAKPADNKKASDSSARDEEAEEDPEQDSAPYDSESDDTEMIPPEEDSENLESTGKAATGVMDI